MIHSISKELGTLNVPSYEGSIKMLPFDLSDLSKIPDQFRDLVAKMIESLPIKKGLAYFTADGKHIVKGRSHRRPGPHIDGNYLPQTGWGDNSGGWKVGEDGKTLSPQDHILSYESNTGGMLIASTYSACKGWNGIFEGLPKQGGDCAHIETNTEPFILKPHTLYYGNSQFLHESVPVDTDIHRTLVRITLPMDYPTINHFE